MMPPRAADRTRRQAVELAVDGRLRRWLGDYPSRLRAWGALIPGLPPLGFLASLLLPGAGQVVHAQARIAIGVWVALGAIGLFAWLDPYLAMITFTFHFLGVLLALVHFHAAREGYRRLSVARGRQVFPVWTVITLVVLSSWWQVSLFDRVANLGRRVVGLTGNLDVYGPLFETGDWVELEAATEATVARGDLVWTDGVHIDRVLGLAGDRLEIGESGQILCNSHPLPANAASQPVRMIGQRHAAPPWWRGVAMKNRVDVGPGEAGFVHWGQTLAVASISALQGRVLGIVAPRERRCRFVCGVMASAPATLWRLF